MVLAVALLILLPAQPLSDPESLWQQTSLYRDEWGTPHVYAENSRALGFGFGYAQAEDHLKEMLLAYRMANGRLAEVLGEAEAESDKFSLKVGHARLARAAWSSLDADTMALCEGFALGVNAWILEHASEVPEWAEGIQPQDVLALWHAYLMSFAPFDLPGVWNRRPAATTGNAWAVASQRSKNGTPMLAINPHEYHDGPFRWYEAHLAMPGYDMAGATIFGLPILLVGRNENLGWCLTPNAPDFADMYKEHFQGAEENPKILGTPLLDDETAMILLYMSHAQPFYVRTESGLEERMAPAYIGPRGPIFEAEDKQLYSWRIGGYDAFGGLLQLLRMGAAQDLPTFQEALSIQQLPCFHVLYADRQNNLFYLYNTFTGERPRHMARERGPDEPPDQETQAGPNWQSPLPASLAGLAWHRMVPVGQLPHVTNPTSGYLQACGNPPWTVTKDAALDPTAWPAWLATEKDGYRAKRARQLLQTGPLSSVEMEAMFFDIVLPAAVDLAPKIVALADERPDWIAAAHPDLKTGIELLRNWNYLAGLDEEAMTYFHVWWATVVAKFSPEIVNPAALGDALAVASPEAVELVLDAAADAARMLRNDFDALSIPWGEAHRIKRGDREEPIFGATTGEPLFIASDQTFDGRHWYADYGTGFAMLVEFGETPEATSLSPFGSSEDPSSRHYDDQLDLLLARKMKQTHYLQRDVWSHAEQATGRDIRLSPTGTGGALNFKTDVPITATLEAKTEAPGLLPPGTAPFTLYMTPKWVPAEAPIDLTFELTIGPELCDERDLQALGIFEYEPNVGWQRLPAQEINLDSRTLLAQSSHATTYAILGPSAALKIAPAPVVPGKPQEDDALPQTAIPVPLTPSETVLEEADASEESVSVEDIAAPLAPAAATDEAPDEAEPEAEPAEKSPRTDEKPRLSGPRRMRWR